MSVRSELRRIDRLIAECRFQAARAGLDAFLQAGQRPPFRAAMLYQLGAICWGELGEGTEARHRFQEVVTLAGGSAAPQELPGPMPVVANSCENLMLLSLSYDEYEQWAASLTRLQPENDILSVHRARVQEARERGQPWAAVLLAGSTLYWNPNAAQDRGRYGSAASILQVLLVQRKSLRLSRDDWRQAVLQYAHLKGRIAVQAADRMRRTRAGVDATEIRALVQPTLPLVEEYLSAHAADAEAQEALQNLRGVIGVAEDLEANGAWRGQGGVTMPASRLLGYLAGTAIGIWLGMRLLVNVPDPWRAIIGGLVGLMIAALTQRRLVGAAATSEGPVRWVSNPDVRRAVASAGVQGLRFKFVGAGLSEGAELDLGFRTVDPIPGAKARDAELALRCVVGVTFPYVVSRAPGCQVMVSPGPAYNVRLGDGVPLPGYVVVCGSNRIGPLQVTSRREDDAWIVTVEPLVLNIGGMADFQSTMVAQARIWEQVVPVFEELKEQTVTL